MHWKDLIKIKGLVFTLHMGGTLCWICKNMVVYFGAIRKWKRLKCPLCFKVKDGQ